MDEEKSGLAKIFLAKIELWLVIVLAVGSLAGTIIFGWVVKRTLTLPPDARFVSDRALLLANVPDYLKTIVDHGLELSPDGELVQRNTQIVESDSVSGLVVQDSSFHDTGMLLVSAYDDGHGISTVYLFDLLTRRRIWEWVPDYDQIVEQTPSLKKIRDAGETITGTDNRAYFRSQAPLLFGDGSIVVMSGEGVLTRIDAHGEPMWTSDGHYHHSIELTADGNIIVPVAVNRDESFRDDGYAVVSPEGKVLEEHFLVDILVRHGYRGLVYGVGRWERDRIHLNDAQPILRSDSFVRAGDVVLSLRHLSTVLLYRPSEDRIIWLRTGPWINQHDVDYLGGGRFRIFGNDWVRVDEDFPTPEHPGDAGWKAFGHSNIYEFDMATGTISRPYPNIFERLGLGTPTQGLQRALDNGDSFVSLTDENELLRLNDHTIRWRYSSPLEAVGAVGALHWSRYFYRGELDLSWIPRVERTRSRSN